MVAMVLVHTILLLRSTGTLPNNRVEMLEIIRNSGGAFLAVFDIEKTRTTTKMTTLYWYR